MAAAGPGGFRSHGAEVAGLGSGNWVIKEKDAEGKLAVRELVVEFMSKIKLCESWWFRAVPVVGFSYVCHYCVPSS